MTGRSMTLREALDRSLNLPTVRIADDVGLPTFFGKLNELGLPPNDGTGLAAALGAVETTPVKMAAAYAPFANGGLYHAPRYISRVTDARGEVIYDAANDVERPHRVWSPQVAYLGLDMIQGVVNDLGTRQGGFSEPAASKAGRSAAKPAPATAPRTCGSWGSIPTTWARSGSVFSRAATWPPTSTPGCGPRRSGAT